jgi:catechol 2,3-dioxygenase-like lactoylglutathione lyase family enzyme
VTQELGLVTLLVDDYDKALSFFVDQLGFSLSEDRPLTPRKRWVVVTPRGGRTGLLLAKAANGQQSAAVGNQSGGRVFLFLETDDFKRDHAAFIERGVRFLEQPRKEDYGIVAVFEDLYGNRWDLIERKT